MSCQPKLVLLVNMNMLYKEIPSMPTIILIYQNDMRSALTVTSEKMFRGFHTSAWHLLLIGEGKKNSARIEGDPVLRIRQTRTLILIFDQSNSEKSSHN